MSPKPRSAEYFDGWYADQAATPTVAEIMNRHMGFPPDTRAGVVIAEYRELCARSDAVLAVTPLSARPRGKHGDPEVAEPPTVRWIVLHVIEETARHAGHLDIARELLDGKTRLAQKRSAGLPSPPPAAR